MFEREKIIELINFWQKTAEEADLLKRNLVDKIDSASREVVDIIGPRRSGKSSVLKLLYQKLAANGQGLFINFEDPFFIENNRAGIVEEIVEVFKEDFFSGLKFLFFDEIQNLEHWERAIHKLRESGKYKIFITGSSAKLLSQELATLLTGRHLSYYLYPLSFAEFLFFKGLSIKSYKEVVLKRRQINKLLVEYLSVGGFPEVVLTGKLELLRQYYLDILTKDITARYDIRQKDLLEKIGVYLLSNSGKTLSLSALRKNYGIAFESAAAYVGYFKEAFLVLELPQFLYSIKAQHKALKKVFASDVGLARNISFRFSEDRGRILENCIFLHLWRSVEKVYYYKTQKNTEVDFLTIKGKAKNLIQVCASLADQETRQREIKSLADALQELEMKSGLIITAEEKEVIKIGSKIIKVVPVSEWLLSLKV